MSTPIPTLLDAEDDDMGVDIPRPQLDDDDIFDLEQAHKPVPLSVVKAPGIPAPPRPTIADSAEPAIHTPKTLHIELSDKDRQHIWISIPGIAVRLHAHHVSRSAEGIGLVLDSEAYDLALQPGNEYTLRFAEESLRTVYIGGKVQFGRLLFLSFIAHPDQNGEPQTR